MSLLIRFVKPEDGALLADFSQKTFRDSFGAFNTPENMKLFMEGPFSREILIGELTEPGNITFLAFWENRLTGYALLKNNTKPELAGEAAVELARIYVDLPHTGKGVGKVLLQQCIDHALEIKKNTIWLGVWEHNRRAIEFYARHGFERFGKHIFLLGNDPQTDWLMKKQIS